MSWGDSLELAFIYEQVWGIQPDGHFCLTLVALDKDEPQTKTFVDCWHEKRDGVLTVPTKLRHMLGGPACDVYFCPCAFSEPRRVRANALPSRWLFADLDYMPPQEAAIPPTTSWETSPGKWQALWQLSYFMEGEDYRVMNRAMCRAANADPGTWNENRLLRVPGSPHLKTRRAALELRVAA